jgi:hypothetical protein
MTAPAIPSPIWIVVSDYGPRIGVGSADFLTDKKGAASRWADETAQGNASRVIEVNLSAGTSRDCTDECEDIAAPWAARWTEAAE